MVTKNLAHELNIERSPQKINSFEFKTLAMFQNENEPGKLVALNDYFEDWVPPSLKRLQELGLLRIGGDTRNPSASLTEDGIELLKQRPTIQSLREKPVMINGLPLSAFPF